MKKNFFVGMGVLILLAMIFACAPKAAPVPAPAPVTPQAAPATPILAASAMSPEDAAWQKVVEAAKKEGKVVLYSFSFTGGVGIQLAKAFEERYGISVDIIT
ncbi:MAG: hypothetical protein AABZ77_04650, partial [Chloroflexota bacterium]